MDTTSGQAPPKGCNAKLVGGCVTAVVVVGVVVAAVLLSSSGSSGDDSSGSGSGSGSTGSQNLIQYTPNQANWSTFYSKPASVSSVKNHTPDGVTWLSQSAWQTWDGTVYRPNNMTRNDFYAAICPSIDTIRGLKELFYQHNPFADVNHPTKAEVDEWHRLSLNHLRALIGYTESTRQVEKDHCMFARALWGQQRKFTTMWDSAYPSGTCTASNPHCGASFVPNATDQAPYLPAGHATCGTPGGSEGVTSAPKSNIPWCIKWVRAFCTFLLSEGYWGGHVGPFFHRQKFGWSFWDNAPSNNNNNAVFRGKWTGTLMPNLYPQP